MIAATQSRVFNARNDLESDSYIRRLLLPEVAVDEKAGLYRFSCPFQAGAALLE
jgi:hypothetical protein